MHVAGERHTVAIVGYGPVGQMAAILLGRRGHDVVVFERWPEVYPRPRAVHYDDEIARIFQSIGIAEQLRELTEPATTYEWLSADGQTLLLLDRREPGPSGWPAATMFTQPDLERLLDRTAKLLPTVSVRQGWEVSSLTETEAGVELSARHGEVTDGRWIASGEHSEVLADYVIGCDGANSIVREAMGAGLHDLGFAFDWLIADTIPHDPSLLAGVNLQRCDPARPTTMVSGGPGRRRWEWMLLPAETREHVENEAFVWEMLAGSGISERDVALERYALYTFRARWAERWRAGRMLLAGDAAHLMPPFAGQGMCSGIRDAFTLAWQLDLILTGAASPTLLDAYSSERQGHLQHAIALSVELGKVMCITDPGEAAARDTVLLSLRADPSTPAIEPPAPLLGPGLHDAPADGGAAGSLFPQGRIPGPDGPCLLEAAIESGFVLYSLDRDPLTSLDGETSCALEELGATQVAITSTLDIDGTYRAWFERHDCVAALVRPDFYVFATAHTDAEISDAVRRLSAALNDPSTPDQERPER